jgi:DnaJ-class molecular chaperone
MAHSQACSSCAGTGLTARQRRSLENGTPDAADIIGQVPGLCEKCGGSGAMPLDLKTVTEKKAGFAADSF